MSDKKRPWRIVCQKCRRGPCPCTEGYWYSANAALQHLLSQDYRCYHGMRRLSLEHWDGAKWVPVEEGEGK